MYSVVKFSMFILSVPVYSADLFQILWKRIWSLCIFLKCIWFLFAFRKQHLFLREVLLLPRNRASMCRRRHDGRICHTLASRCMASAEAPTPLGQNLPRRQTGQVSAPLSYGLILPLLGQVPSIIGASYAFQEVKKKPCRIREDLLSEDSLFLAMLLC